MTISLSAKPCRRFGAAPRAARKSGIGRRATYPEGVIRPRVLAAGTMAAAVLAGLLAASPAQGRPAISGGTSAAGSPAVVAIATYDGDTWRVCSAALLRPRVLVTAAHCMTRPGTSERVRKVRVFPPGARARVYSNTGPRRPSPIRVTKWWLGADIVRDSTVRKDDVAVLLLNGDLGPQAFTRVADSADLARWRAARTPVIHQGYGGTATRRYSPLPQTIALPFANLALGSSLGPIFSTAATSNQALCTGDSGGPAFVVEGTSAYLVGTMAGAQGACSSTAKDSPTNLGLATIGYLPIVDAAFTEAGYLPIPSAPRQVAQRARNRDVTITWSPPATAAETVAGYQVVDGAGTVVCQSATPACTLTSLPDGTYTYAVRARNAEGEGDVAAGGPGSVIASPPQPAPPTVTRVSRSRYTVTITTIAGRTSAVVRSYLVRDQAGTAVCTLPVADQAAPSLSCSWSPRRGTYTLTVAADTEMGPSPTSAPSARISVR